MYESMNARLLEASYIFRLNLFILYIFCVVFFYYLISLTLILLK